MNLTRISILAIVSMLVFSGATLAQGPSPQGHPDAPAQEGLGSLDLLDDPYSQVDCAPPCGYIWPRIGVHADIQSPFPLSNVRDFPSKTEIQVTYSWDIEQEGTGINDPAQEMQITIVVTRTPAFLSASLDRHTCSFTLLPVVSEYDVCTLTLSVDLDETYLPRDEDELRETGHRLMLFAASEESGTFMKSYGLEDIRFRFDELPEGAESAGPSRTDDMEATESPMGLFVGLTAIFLLAMFAVNRSRRR